MNLLTTAQVSPSQRYSYWQEAVCDVFVELDCKPLSERVFEGTIASSQVGQLTFSRVDSHEQHVVRTPQRIRQARQEVLLISLQLEGRALVRQDDREAVIEAGQMALYDSTRPYELCFGDIFSQLVIHMPREALAPHLGSTRRLTAQTLSSANSSVVALLASYLRQLPQTAEQSSGPTAQRLSEVALELIGVALSETQAPEVGGKPWSREALLQSAKTFIRNNLSDPELCGEQIAQALGISQRYLQMLFCAENTTVRDWIIGARLEQIRIALGSPLASRQPIGELAFAWGFNDLSHFSRRFKQAYGVSPREYSLGARGER